MTTENNIETRRAQLAYATRDLEQIRVIRGYTRAQAVANYLVDFRGLRDPEIIVDPDVAPPRLDTLVDKYDGAPGALVDELIALGWRVLPFVEETHIFEQVFRDRLRAESPLQMATNDGQPSALSRVIEYWGAGPTTDQDKQNFREGARIPQVNNPEGFSIKSGLSAVLRGRGFNPDAPFTGSWTTSEDPRP